MTEHPPRHTNLADVVPALAEVLESFGYTIEQWNSTFPPYGVSAFHKDKTNVPVIVSIFDTAIEVVCPWPFTHKAEEDPVRFLVMVNEMNIFCRLVICGAESDYLTMRAWYPFVFQQSLFRSFMEVWMEDVREVLAVIQRRSFGFLDFENIHVH